MAVVAWAMARFAEPYLWGWAFWTLALLMLMGLYWLAQRVEWLICPPAPPEIEPDRDQFQ
jgi:hypothetical protein